MAAILLLVGMVLVAAIAYVALIAAGVSLLAMKLGWGWPVSLSAAGLIHLALLGVLYRLLRSRASIRPFEATSAELRRDIDALGGYARRSQ